MPKTALAAATFGCLALSLASPNTAAVAAETTEATTDNTSAYCPRPGTETVADGAEISTATADQDTDASSQDAVPVLHDAADGVLRVATYDVQLTRDAEGDLFEELSSPGTPDAADVARVIQTVRPDVLVLTGIDVDAGDNVANAFNTNYLAVGSDNTTGITYPYSFTGTSNAGVDSGADLDRNGTIGDPGDALGYGEFPGQASMIMYSKYPIDADNIRDFTSMPWNAMPDNNIPTDLSDLERSMLPLSSVSHWDVPVDVDDETVHVLASSTADASQTDYDAARNHDQIRFWRDYLDPETEYIRDHRGESGALSGDERFIIAGSLKADPHGNGPADATAINALLDSEAIIDPEPTRTITSSVLGNGILPDGEAARTHTAPTPSNNDATYRADYVLPSANFSVDDAGVLEPETQSSDGGRGFFGLPSGESTNHIVWADLAVGN